MLSYRVKVLLVSAVAALWTGAAVSADSVTPIDVLEFAPGFQMMTVDGVNVVVQTGPEGTVVVNAGPASSAAALLAAIKQHTSTPIRYVLNTNADPAVVGGAATLAAAGESMMQDLPGQNVRAIAMNVATQNAQTALASEPGFDLAALPTQLFSRPVYSFYLNDEPIQVIATPAGRSNADAVVMFRKSNVVVAGNIFDNSRFPVIDLAHGGSIQGELDALNKLLNEMVFTSTPTVTDGGGTLVIPVRGAVSDQADLLGYRNMVGIIRDRIRELIDQGKSLVQVQAARPTQGYDSRYGSSSGRWTTHDFVEAVYKSLKAEQGARRKR
jgi:glyoxylase-like metal-dependent hydrolase (beta-lactamase superfamily II)